MDWLQQDALITASCIWREDNNEPWLVTFDFAVVDERLECVGMRMRSFIEVEREDEFGTYRAVCVGEVTRDDLLPPTLQMPKLNLLDPTSRRAYVKAVERQEVKPKHPARQDPEAVDALLNDAAGTWAPEFSPRPLRTATLRQLPLGSLQAYVRRQLSQLWRSGSIVPRTTPHEVEVDHGDAIADELSKPLDDRGFVSREREELEQRTWELLQRVKRCGGWDDELIRERDELEHQFGELDAREGARPEAPRAPAPSRRTLLLDAAEFRRLTQQAAGSFSSPAHKPGRPAKFSPAHLELVARLYREAFAAGSRSPTKDVARKLELSRNQAAKLVMRCRHPQIGLLAPTTPRRAGGIGRPPQQHEDTT